MKDIEFDAHFGDEVKHITIYEPNGNWGTYNILINNYARGVMHKRNGQWVYNNHWLTMDDVQAIGERIDEHIAAGNPPSL